eukprot:CFRG2606T1
MTRSTWNLILYLVFVFNLITCTGANFVRVGERIFNPEEKGVPDAVATTTKSSVTNDGMFAAADVSDGTVYETVLETETVVITRSVANRAYCNATTCSVVELCVSRNLTYDDVYQIVHNINDILCSKEGCGGQYPFHLVDFYEYELTKNSRWVIVGTICSDLWLDYLIDYWLTGELCCTLDELFPPTDQNAQSACCGFTVGGNGLNVTIPQPIPPMPPPALPPNCITLGLWYNSSSGIYEWVCTICNPGYAAFGLGCVDCNYEDINTPSGCQLTGYCGFEDLYCTGSFSGDFVIVCPGISCCDPSHIVSNPFWPGMFICIPCTDGLLCANHTCAGGQVPTSDIVCNNDECSNCCRQLYCTTDQTCKTGYLPTNATTCVDDDCSNCCYPDLCLYKDCPDGFKKSASALCTDEPDCENCCEPKTCAADTSCGLGLVPVPGQVDCIDDACSNCCMKLFCDDVICPDGWTETSLNECLTDFCIFCCKPELCSQWPCPPGYNATGDVICEDEFCGNCCELALECKDKTCRPGFNATDDVYCTNPECTNCCKILTCDQDRPTCPIGYNRTDAIRCTDNDCSNCCEPNLCVDYACPAGEEPSEDILCTTFNCANCCKPLVCLNATECGDGEVPSGEINCNVDSCDNCCVQLVCRDEICTEPGQIPSGDVNCTTNSCDNCCEQRICADVECFIGFRPADPFPVNCTDPYCLNCCDPDFCGTHQCVDGDTLNGFPVCLDPPACNSCCRQLTCADDHICNPGEQSVPDQVDCVDNQCSNCCESKICEDFVICGEGLVNSNATNCTNDECSNCCEQLYCGDISCTNGMVYTPDDECVDDDCTNCCIQRACSEVLPCPFNFQDTGMTNCTNSFCTNCCKPEFCAFHACPAGQQQTGSILCENPDCSNCCEQLFCVFEALPCPDGFFVTGDIECENLACSNCCQQKLCKDQSCEDGFKFTNDSFCVDSSCGNCCEPLRCDTDNTCTGGLRPNNSEIVCEDNTCDNCCFQAMCSSVDCESMQLNSTADVNCTNQFCLNCCKPVQCSGWQCPAGQLKTTDILCVSDDCANCCEDQPCNPEDCGDGYIPTTDPFCTDDVCSNCCEHLDCASNRPCVPGEMSTGSTFCTDDQCSNCCEQLLCNVAPIKPCPQGFNDTGDVNCTDAQCTNCCVQLLCLDPQFACQDGDQPTNETICTDNQCLNCCEDRFCSEDACVESGLNWTGNDTCTDNDCTNCCELKQCAIDNPCLDTQKPTGAINCTSGDTPCDNCCEDKTCEIDINCTAIGQFPQPGESTCLDGVCSNCCYGLSCSDNCASGEVSTGATECTDPNCSNCCNMQRCDNPIYECVLPNLPTGNLNCTGFPNNDSQLSTICDNCCAVANCSNVDCGPGLLPSGEEFCNETSCAVCCTQQYCAELECVGIECSNVEHPSGDVLCIDLDCTNCCDTCNDGIFGPSETCEYLANEDRWIVPKNSSLGVESGNPNYNYLRPDLSCNDFFCQVENCVSEEWQRVCTVQSGFIRTDFIDYPIPVPQYDQSFTGVPLVGIDLAITGEVSGTIVITNGPGNNVVTTLYKATIEFTSPAIPQTIAVVPNTLTEDIPLAPNEVLILGGLDYFASDSTTTTIAAANWPLFIGSGYIDAEMDGYSQTEITGLNLRANITTVGNGIVRVRYRYAWCPTPGAAAAGELPVPSVEECSVDTPLNPDWNIPRCGDNIIEPELGEECDGIQGTNSTFYCSDMCQLVANKCGDGVIWGTEECDYLFGQDIFPDPPPTINRTTTRCRKTYDADVPPAIPCTLQTTMCGDGNLTDNEECDYVPGGIGILYPQDLGDWCNSTCQLNSIENCEYTVMRQCQCASDEYSSTYCLTQNKTVGGADCLDNNGQVINFDSNGKANLTMDGVCVCTCGNGVVDTQNGEECDLGPDGILSPTTVCKDCMIVTSFCGDGIIDPIRGETCELPFSQGGNISNIDGTDYYCDNDCHYATAGECVFTETCTDCMPCPDGLHNCTTNVDNVEVPPGYMGGCPSEGTVSSQCTCDQCYGEWIPWTNSTTGELRCQYNGEDCNQMDIFARVNGSGRICEDINDPGVWIKINTKRVNDTHPNQCEDQCIPCVEDYGDIKCDTLCGPGQQVGTYNITQYPDNAINNGGKASRLKCKCFQSDGVTPCVVGECLPIPSDQCNASLSNTDDDCACNGESQSISLIRRCRYSVPANTDLATFPYVELQIAKFFRPKISPVPQCVSATSGSLKSVLKRITVTSISTIDGTVFVENLEGIPVEYTVTWSRARLILSNKASGEVILTVEFADQTQLSVIDNSELFSFQFPEKSTFATFSSNLNAYKTNSITPAYETILVDANDSKGTVAGGGNVASTTTGTYGMSIEVIFHYDKCNVGEINFSSNYAECDEDELELSVVV